MQSLLRFLPLTAASGRRCSARNVWTGPRRATTCRLGRPDGADAGPSTARVTLLTDEEAAAAALPAALQADLRRKQTATVHRAGPEPQRLVYVGLGGAGQLSAAGYRKAAVQAVAALRAAKCMAADIEVTGSNSQETLGTISQSVLLSNYHFDKYLAPGDDAPHLLQRVSVSGSDGHLFEDIELAAMCDATVFARDLVNEQPDVAHPAMLEAAATAVAADHGMRLTVLRGVGALEEAGLRLHAAVGQGSVFEPRLVTLEYRGAPDCAKTVLLVGKGITFDTGGLNLKPTGFMETMHHDMGGAAATLAAMDAVGRLGIKVNVVCALALAENAIGSRAYKPHSIIQSHKGLTVQVGNTDAEGRLVLADALSYGQQQFAPDTVINVATLTGACVVALGPYAAGLFSNDDRLSADLIMAGEQQHERLWRLPILPEHTEELKCHRADLSSTGEGRYGGACTAAAFLQKFVMDGVKWAHLDIAGPADSAKDRGHFKQGGTGFGAQAITRYLLSRATITK